MARQTERMSWFTFALMVIENTVDCLKDPKNKYLESEVGLLLSVFERCPRSVPIKKRAWLMNELKRIFKKIEIDKFTFDWKYKRVMEELNKTIPPEK